jgi:hypothetical protein
MGGQVSVFEGENQLLEISVASLSDEVKLKRPVAYLPPTHPSHEAFSVSIQPYRLPSSKDLWLGEIRSKLDDAAQVERVSCEIQFPTHARRGEEYCRSNGEVADMLDIQGSRRER